MRLIMPYNNKQDNKNQKIVKNFKDNRKIKDVKNNYQRHNFNNKEVVSFDDYDSINDRENILSPEDKGFIIGRNPVIEALKAEKQIDVIYVNKDAGGSINLICKLAKEQGIVIKQVNDTKLSYMSNGASHQGVIASGACAEYVSVEDVLAVSKNKGTQPFIIVCDEIEDPHNLGAIIRTAEAAGADGIIIPKRRSASLNQTVFKTSAGAASWLPVARVSNIAAAIDMLKENGIWVYGTDADGEDYTGTNLTGSMALVIGSEGNGIGRLVREKCDFLIKLPMLGKITSLNASVAAGIFMYETVRQRQLKLK
jgi:23S rRNA (guanosine2251-2'-O)-methyltransferase